MARCPFTVQLRDGSRCRITKQAAGELLHDGLVELIGSKLLLMLPAGRSGGRLSLKVGSTLASATLRYEQWAAVATEHVLRQ